MCTLQSKDASYRHKQGQISTNVKLGLLSANLATPFFVFCPLLLIPQTH